MEGAKLEQKASESFGEDQVRALSSSLSEPGWLLELRLDAFQKYLALPEETNPLYTKYASSFGLDLSKHPLSTETTKADFRSFFGGYLSGAERNILLQANENVIHSEIDEELSSKGVVFASLSEAIRNDEGLVRGLFEGRVVRSE